MHMLIIIILTIKINVPPPKSITPRAPDPRNTAPLSAGTLAATAFTGVAGGGTGGIIAVASDCGGTLS